MVLAKTTEVDGRFRTFNCANSQPTVVHGQWRPLESALENVDDGHLGKPRRKRPCFGIGRLPLARAKPQAVSVDGQPPADRIIARDSNHSPTQSLGRGHLHTVGVPRTKGPQNFVLTSPNAFSTRSTRDSASSALSRTSRHSSR